MCIGSKKSAPAPLPPAEPIEQPDVAPTPDAPLVAEKRKRKESENDVVDAAKAGTSALRVNLNLPSATGVNAPV